MACRRGVGRRGKTERFCGRSCCWSLHRAAHPPRGSSPSNRRSVAAGHTQTIPFFRRPATGQPAAVLATGDSARRHSTVAPVPPKKYFFALLSPPVICVSPRLCGGSFFTRIDIMCVEWYFQHFANKSHSRAWTIKPRRTKRQCWLSTT